MKAIKERLLLAGSQTGMYFVKFVKWVVLAAVLGGICGTVGAGFHKSLDYVTELRMEHSWIIWFLPVAGFLTLLLYKLCRVSFSAGTNLIFESVSENKHVPILLAPLIFAGTVLSHLCGASVGREGAALQLGGSIGHNFGELLRMKKESVQVLAMCGMAGCFAALFGTPLTAAIFVLEVICVGTIRYNAFLPCVLTAYCSFLTADLWHVEPLAYSLVNEIPLLSWQPFLAVLVLGALCALVSIVFCTGIHTVSHAAEKYLKNPFVRIAAGGLLMAVVTALFGLYDYAGAGTHIIENAMLGQGKSEAFIIKILLTALCVGVGFRGGEIVPTMFVGATFGCFVGPFLGLSPDFAAAVGLIAMFCAVVNCPIASIFMAAELFGTVDLPLFVIAVAVSFALSGYFGLYSSQRILFSKVEPKVIDIHTK